jgi:multidrug efflux pump subunit AcrB
MNTRHQEAVEKNTNTPGGYLIRHPKVSFLIGLTLVIWGFLSTLSIPKESAPYIEFGIVSINTVFTGASAIDIDTLITQEIEDKIKNISGINKYTSVSRNSVSSITLEFEPGQNMTKAMGDIRSKVDEAKPSLPSEINDDPQITEIDSSIEPFLSIILSGDVSSLLLTDVAEELRNVLEDVPDVAEVSINGGKQREISVQVDQDQIESLGIPLSDITSAIRQSHRDTPIGDLEIDGYDYSIRFEGKHQNAEDVQNIILKNARNDNVPSLIVLGDVALVKEREEDVDSVFRFARTDESGALEPFQNAVEISLSRKSRSDILAVDERAKAAVERFVANKLPKGIHVEYARQSAEIMRDDYRQVLVSGLQSVFIVMLFIFFFVGVMEGLVASIVIPTSFLVTIGVLGLLGSTLNFMTNFSMILSLGILVDTAIVIVEGAHRFIKMGFSRKEAAILTLNEYRAPLISGILTTVAVFIPLLSLSGILGQYLSFIPVTVIIVLLSSLFISLLLLPSYAAQLLPQPKKSNPQNNYHPTDVLQTRTGRIRFRRWKRLAGFSRSMIDSFIQGIINGYCRILQKLLSRRFSRLSLFGLVIFLFFASFRISIPFELFPQSDQPFLTISVQMPQGATTSTTFRVAKEVENVIADEPEVLFVETSVNGNTATISLELIENSLREEMGLRNSMELEDDIFVQTDVIADAYGASIRARSAQNGPPSDFPVGFRIIARDRTMIEEAQEVAIEATEILKSLPGTMGVKNDIEKIPGEFRFTVDRAKAIALGIPPSTIAETVRTALQGSTAAVITRDGRDIDIVVELKENDISSISDIESLSVYSSNGSPLPLREVINRQRRDALATLRRNEGDIAFTVSSLLGEGGNAGIITNAFLQKIESGALSLPDGVEIVNAGENEENADLIMDLLRGFVLAILIMFLILVIQFNGFLQPVLILFTILFAQIGVTLGLFLTDTPRSLAYILGIIALSGIVVNNAIIMIDQMNRNRSKSSDISHQSPEKKETKRELVSAIIEAGRSRFVPVILTTLTTSAGIIPLIFQDEFWAGLSYTVVFGLLVASVLTLVITPITYFQFETEKWKTSLFLLAVILGSNGLLSFVFGSFIPGIVLMAIGLLFFLLFLWALKRERRRNIRDFDVNRELTES